MWCSQLEILLGLKRADVEMSYSVALTHEGYQDTVALHVIKNSVGNKRQKDLCGIAAFAG